jgi:hypothetical protein
MRKPSRYSFPGGPIKNSLDQSHFRHCTHDCTRKRTLLVPREAKTTISRRDGETGCRWKTPQARQHGDNHCISCRIGCVFEIVSRVCNCEDRPDAVMT